MNSEIHDDDHFTFFSFEMPENVKTLTIEFKFNTENKAQIPIALYDQENQLRAIKVSEHALGDSVEGLWISDYEADKGCIPGHLSNGTWKIVLYKKYLLNDITCNLSVTVEEGETKTSSPTNRERPDITLDPREKWYCGELHMHSTESTGRTSVSEVINTAANEKLDFIAITDHFTISHWNKIDEQADENRPLVIHSCELSGELGHANLHGIKSWISPFVDGNENLFNFLDESDYSMNKIADIVHEEGGLFSINHPLSARVGWRYHDFDLKKADIIEVVSLPDGPNSFQYTALWDRLLCNGQRITGVGSSDSHHPDSDGPWKLGVLRTWVYADNLSEKSLIKGLKSGRVYVTHGDVRIDFFAVNFNKKSQDLERYETGSLFNIQGEDETSFVVSLKNHPKGNLYIFSDGLILDVMKVKGSEAVNQDWEEVQFTLGKKKIKPGTESYIRAEFHEEIVEPYYEGMAYRDHTSLRALTNPIWISSNK